MCRDFQRDANIITFTPTLIVSDKPLHLTFHLGEHRQIYVCVSKRLHAKKDMSLASKLIYLCSYVRSLNLLSTQTSSYNEQ